MKNKGKINDLTYAAMMIAIFVVIHFIFPANNRSIQSVLGAITPIPIAIYCASSDFKKNIMVCATGLFLTLLFFEPIMVLSFIVPSLIFGLVLGTMLKKELSWLKVLLLICLCIGFNLYEMYINYLITGLNFIEINVLTIKMSIGATKEYFPNINEQILFDLNIVLLPLMFIVGGTLKTIITCYLTTSIVERLSGKKVEHKELEYYTSSSILFEVVVLSIYTVTILTWVMFLLGIIPYLFIYSILLDVTLFFVFLYYGIIHGKITKKFRDNKIKYICVSLVYMSIFFIISPIAALKKIIKQRRTV